mmetsp:Transcript_4630/g.19735  ORF Transcript_4630/g.19735 Transcript_4630/m.19735 type:complete len:266 (-) Transcript_4630:1389-2186(-)
MERHGRNGVGDQDGTVQHASSAIAARRRDHRAARLRAVVREDGFHGGAGARRVGVRRAHHRAHQVRKNLPRLAHGHTGLVHLEAALVGTQDPGVLRAQGRRRARGGARGRGERVILRVRRRARRRGGVRQGERHARRCVWRWLGVVPGRGRFGHVVLLRVVAVLHAGVAEGRRGGFGKVLPHDGDGDGPRHIVLLGRAHGDAVVRHDREAAFQDGVPARARARREGKKDVQVPRERRRPAERDRGPGVRRVALHPRHGHRRGPGP